MLYIECFIYIYIYNVNVFVKLRQLTTDSRSLLELDASCFKEELES